MTLIAEIDGDVRCWSPSEVKTSVTEVDYLADCPTGKDERKRAQRLIIVFFVFEWGFSHRNLQA